MVNGERLLLVEDDAATRELLTLLLEGEGWTVQAVDSGEAALRLTAAADPAVVLCDLHLPGICGEALGLRLREALPAKTLVLGMTASPSANEAGYDGMAIKPFPPGAIEAAWLQALQRTPDDRDLAVTRFGTEGIGGSVGLNVSMGALVLQPGAVRAELDEPVLDLTTMERLRGSMGDRGMREFYAFALGDAGDRLQRMETATATQDDAAFTREAHALKGSSGMIGAREVWRLAADAETEGLNSSSGEKVSRLYVAIQAVRLMLETLFPV